MNKSLIPSDVDAKSASKKNRSAFIFLQTKGEDQCQDADHAAVSSLST